MMIEILTAGARSGPRLPFADHFPGISDVEKALSDGYTTGSGMGLASVAANA
jgi:serine/threonine-protein kinase RsbT